MNKKLTSLQAKCLEHLNQHYADRAFNSHMLAGAGFDWMQLEGLYKRGYLVALDGKTGNDAWYRLAILEEL